MKQTQIDLNGGIIDSTCSKEESEKYMLEVRSAVPQMRLPKDGRYLKDPTTWTIFSEIMSRPRNETKHRENRNKADDNIGMMSTLKSIRKTISFHANRCIPGNFETLKSTEPDGQIEKIKEFTEKLQASLRTSDDPPAEAILIYMKNDATLRKDKCYQKVMTAVKEAHHLQQVCTWEFPHHHLDNGVGKAIQRFKFLMFECGDSLEHIERKQRTKVRQALLSKTWDIHKISPFTVKLLRRWSKTRQIYQVKTRTQDKGQDHI